MPGKGHRTRRVGRPNALACRSRVLITCIAPPRLAGWTEDRIGLLKELWADGIGAAQIAKRLGGVTRSAVIGKVRRLGMTEQRGHLERAPHVRVVKQAGVTVTVLTLGVHMCKWPIGDPSGDDFTFCGRRTLKESPYCAEHARIAYQPQPRAKAADRKAAVQGEVVIELRRRFDA